MLRRWLLQKTCKGTWLRRGVRRAAQCPDEGTSTATSSCTGDPGPPRAPSHCNSLMPFHETPKHAEKVIASPQRTTSVSDLSALVMRIWVQMLNKCSKSLLLPMENTRPSLSHPSSHLSVCPFKTSPCVRSKRPNVCQHHAHMCFNMWAWCWYTCGRFERTHTGFSSVSQHTTQDTRHNTQ